MGTQHAHRVVVKKNTSTEDMCNNTEEKHREYSKLGKLYRYSLVERRTE